MTSPPSTFSPAASWTYKTESEQAQEHDFSNLLAEFAYAVQRQDRMMINYCESELKRMFRAAVKGAGKGGPRSERLVSRTMTCNAPPETDNPASSA